MASLFRDGLGLSDTIYRIPSARKELGLFVFTLYLSLIYMTYPLEWIYISFVLKTMIRNLLVQSEWQNHIEKCILSHTTTPSLLVAVLC